MEFWSLSTEAIDQSIRAHYALQTGQFFSDVTEVPEGLITRSPNVGSFIWNHVAVTQPRREQLGDFITRTKDNFQIDGRSFAFYLSPATYNPNAVVEALLSLGFNEEDHEAWMYYLDTQPPRFQIPSEIQINRVTTLTEMDVFIGVFEQAYEGASPAYGHALRNQFIQHGAGIGVHHFVVYSSGSPVSIATLISDGVFGGIYSVGTPPSHRKQGLGSLISMYATTQALQLGCKTIFLQAERGPEGPERMYRRLGFNTVFVRLGYTLP